MASARSSSLGLERVSVALPKSGSPPDPFREPVRRRIHVRRQRVVPLRRWVAGCFLLVLIMAVPALVLRVRQSRNDVPELILQRHHFDHDVDQVELPVASSSVLASIAAADTISIVSSAEHDFIYAGMELSTSRTHQGLIILIFDRSVHVAAYATSTSIWILGSQTHV